MSVLGTAISDLARMGDETIINIGLRDSPDIWLSGRHAGYGLVQLSTNHPITKRLLDVGWALPEPEPDDPRYMIQGSKRLPDPEVYYLDAAVGAHPDLLRDRLEAFISASFGGQEWSEINTAEDDIEDPGQLDVEDGLDVRLYRSTIEGLEPVSMDAVGQGFYLAGTIESVDDVLRVRVRGNGVAHFKLGTTTRSVFATVLVPGQDLSVWFVVRVDERDAAVVGLTPPGLGPTNWTLASMTAELNNRASNMEEHGLSYDAGTQAGRWLAVDRTQLRDWNLACAEAYPQVMSSHWKLWQDLGWFNGQLPPLEGWEAMLRVRPYWASALAMLSVAQVERWGASAQSLADLTPDLSGDEYDELLALATKGEERTTAGYSFGDRLRLLADRIEAQRALDAEDGLDQTWL